MSITPMTTGHMKQVIRRIYGSVPTDLSQKEAEHIASSPSVTEELEVLWFRLRNPVGTACSVFPVYIHEKFMNVMENHGMLLVPSYNKAYKPKAEITSLEAEFGDSCARLEALEIKKMSGSYSSGAEIAKEFEDEGYVSASFDELIAFATQHSDYFASRGHLYVHILKPTKTGRFPMVWYDRDHRVEPCLQLSFDSDDDEGLLNQVQASEIHVLVKKK